MNAGRLAGALGLAAILLAAGGGMADITIETVLVGNPGNAGELSGTGAGGHGTDRICGAVDYEYNIGKYEVTAGQYTEFLNAVGGVDTYALYNTVMWTRWGSGITRSGGGTVGDPYTYSVATDFANRPVNYVSWGDAARFANWLTNGQPSGAQDLFTTEDGAYYLNGATSDAALLAVVVPNATQRATWAAGEKPYFLLPSEDEWYKAAYHKNDGVTGNYFDYPTASDTAPGQDMADVSGNNANYYTDPYVFPIDSGKYTTLVGEFQNSESPYGTFDQGGNVWEWNESVLFGSCRGLRAGSFAEGYRHLHAAVRNNNGYGRPTLEDSFFGFRVSEVPEPASMAVLALGSIGILLRRGGLRR